MRSYASAAGTRHPRLLFANTWDDPANLIVHRCAPFVVLQFGRQDSHHGKMARRYFELFAEPKKLEFYDAGHALNDVARRERADWLKGRLSLKAIDYAALARIPESK